MANKTALNALMMSAQEYSLYKCKRNDFSD